MPKESDAKGTAFRIRPQTPKLNLLIQNKPDTIKGKRTAKRPHHLEALPIVPKKLPFPIGVKKQHPLDDDFEP